jgi:RNA polymerase sigma-70 factor (ECF subfamily)
MLDVESFKDLMQKIRAGDQLAATEFVRQYEPFIRREVRLLLDDSRLKRLFDSTDIAQSVMCSFFVRTCGGQYELEDPKRLVGLLVSMAKNKLISTARRQLAYKRDGNRVEMDSATLESQRDFGETSSQAISVAEVVAQCRLALSDDERQIADLRSQNKTWEQIAEQLGGTADGRRVQMARATARIMNQFGLGE